MMAGAKRGRLEEERVQTRLMAEDNRHARAVFLDRDGTLMQIVRRFSTLRRGTGDPATSSREKQ